MLNVFLGYACNFECAYCLQDPKGADAVRKRHPVEPFVEKIAPFLKDRGITEVAYWGGEPLIYWDAIEAIHEALIAAGVPLGFVKLVTNGSLLEDRHIEVLNRWGAYVVVSQHGPFGEPRWEQATRLKNSAISFLFTHKSLFAWPWFREIDQLEQGFGRPFFPYVHWVRATDGCDASWYLTHADLDAHVPHLRELAERRVAGDRHAHGMFEGHLTKWRKALGAPSRPPAPLCHADDHVSVDLAGNRYGCHHSVRRSLRTGHLFEPEPATPETAAALRHVRRFVDTAECRRCPINRWCRGNCHLSQTHDVDCRLAKAKHELFAWIAEQEGASLADLHDHAARTRRHDRTAPL